MIGILLCRRNVHVSSRGLFMMNHYLLSIAVSFLLLSPLSIASCDTQQNMSVDPFDSSAKATIYVDDSNTYGPWDGSYEHPYQYITDGVSFAAEGDMVYVFNGLYLETLHINKSLYLLGQSQDNTIIDGQNTNSVIIINASNVSIRRFTIRNSSGYKGDAGIVITQHSATITECTFYRTPAGISIYNTSNSNIFLSCFHTNGFGILFSSSDSGTIDQCTFYHNGVGLYIYNSSCVTITDSYADTNGIGFLFEDSSHIQVSRSAARDNDDNEGGMFFVGCTYVEVVNCHLMHNGVGINLVNSSACYIERCNISLNTHFGCKLKMSVSSVFFTNCIITQNLRFGFYAQDSMFTVSWSNIYDNKYYGLYEESTSVEASYNWWGSRRGPAHTGLVRADRATLSPRETSYIPWLTFPMPDIGPDWYIDKTFQKPEYSLPWPEQIVFSDPDTDGDGAPDWWEQKWGYDPSIWEDHQQLDPDNDSLNNIEECYMDQYDANPFHKDVYLELDWHTALQQNVTNKPSEKGLTQMMEAYARHDITLHIDTGQLGGGEEIPSEPYATYADIITLYWEYFLHNNLNNPRQYIFHYGLICDRTEGPGFAVMGWNHLNGFVVGAQFLSERYPFYTRGRVVSAVIMHELGHTFGLIVTKYNGIDNKMTHNPLYKEFWIYLPYRSILSYQYTYSIMDYSDGSHGRNDYDDWGNLDFSFFKNTSFTYPV